MEHKSFNQQYGLVPFYFYFHRLSMQIHLALGDCKPYEGFALCSCFYNNY
jgi:hypothetical protein